MRLELLQWKFWCSLAVKLINVNIIPLLLEREATFTTYCDCFIISWCLLQLDSKFIADCYRFWQNSCHWSLLDPAQQFIVLYQIITVITAKVYTEFWYWTRKLASIANNNFIRLVSKVLRICKSSSIFCKINLSLQM